MNIMSFTYEEKESSSPLVDVFWQTEDQTDGTYIAPADGSWDMIFTRTLDGEVTVRLSGPSATTTPVHYKKGNRNIGMRMKQGVFFTHIPVSDVVDVTEVLPMPTKATFLLGGHLLEIPTYEAFDEFTMKLEELGLVSKDPMVRASLEGVRFGASKRSLQRRFSGAIGMTPAYIAQIERAWQAAHLLKKGTPITEVVHELGYADQAHLNRSMKRITGLTPRQNAKRDEPIG